MERREKVLRPNDYVGRKVIYIEINLLKSSKQFSRIFIFQCQYNNISFSLEWNVSELISFKAGRDDALINSIIFYSLVALRSGFDV